MSKPHLRVPLSLALAAAFSIPALAQESNLPAPAPAAPPNCEAEVHRQFDFWVGSWEVKTADGSVAGTNRVEKMLSDCVLMENWEGAGGSTGKSFNMYYRRDQTWRQTWVDGNGGRLDLSGGLDGKDMVLSGEMPGRGGGTTLHEIRWSPLDDGRVSQHWRVSTDGGKTWQEAFLGFYSKRD